jgi:hypothetical protein
VGDDRAIVVATTTIVDGITLRWYRNIHDARNQRELLSASRHGVLVSGSTYLHTIPAGFLRDATAGYEALAARQDDKAHGYVTHVKNPNIGGRIEPVGREKG